MSAVVPSLRGSLRALKFLAWKPCGGGYLRRCDASPVLPSPLISTADLWAVLHLVVTMTPGAAYLLGSEE